MNWILLALLVVSGQVINGLSGKPVPGATVSDGTGLIVETDADGRFSIETTVRSLIVAAPGYRSVTVAVENAPLRVLLHPLHYELDAVVVRGIRGRRSAPGASTHLGPDRIARRTHGEEVPFVLAGAPGVQVVSDAGVPFGYTYLRLRGLDHSRINMTVDGVPLNEPEDHGVYFSNMPDFASSLHSAQVQRGTGTSAFGAATFAGSVHFETLPLATTPRHVRLQSTVGSYETKRLSLEAASGATARGWAGLGRLSAHSTEGFRDHSGSRSYSYFGKAGRPGEVDQWMVTVFGGSSENDMAYLAAPRSALESNLRANPLSPEETDEFAQNVVIASYGRSMSHGWTWTTKLYHNRVDGRYGVRIDDIWTYDLSARWTGALSYLQGQVGSVGIDAGVSGDVYARRHQLYWPDVERPVYTNRGERDGGAAFVRASFPVDRLRLYGDLQLRRTAFRYVPDSRDPVEVGPYAWTFLNPRLGATFRLHGATDLFALIGQTRREPSRNELFAGFDHVGSAEAAFLEAAEPVRPETVRDAEVGVRYQAAPWNVELVVYHMAFSDEIAPIGQLSSIGLPLRKNIESSRRSGAEMDASYERGRMSAGTSIAWTVARIEEYTDGVTGLIFQDVSPLLTPKTSGSARATFRVLRRLTVGIDLEGASRQYLDNTGRPEATMPAYVLSDLRSRLDGGHWSLDLRVNNLFNQTVYRSGYMGASEPHYFPAATRNLMLTGQVTF